MESTGEKNLYLLDGHALVYRAHYSFISRPLINSKGQSTGAIQGFIRFIWEIINNKDRKATHLAVSFDLPGPTFRHKMYEPYKAHRDAQPEDITFAIPKAYEILEAMNIPVIALDGFEADDVIGTIAKKAARKGYNVFMVTPDKDYGQLVEDTIFHYKPGRAGGDIEILGVKEVCEKWGIKRIEQVIDFLGLQGDAADNIPGIPGVGEKTAANLLQQYDTIEDIIAHADQLPGKLKDKVKDNAELGLLSKKLATIDIDAPIDFEEEKYPIEGIDYEKLSVIFKDLEFRTLATAIIGNKVKASPVEEVQLDLFGEPVKSEEKKPAPTPKFELPQHISAEKNIENTAHTYHLVNSEQEYISLVKSLAEASHICLDTETTHIDANIAELVGLSFSTKPKEAYYIPFPEDREGTLAILHHFKSILENPAIVKIGQNIKYDAIILKWYGIGLKGRWFDTMIAHYLLEPDLRHNMNYLSETYLHYQPVSIESLIGAKGKNQGNMRDVPLEKIKEYAAEDADITFQLFEYFKPQLPKENLQKIFDDIEAPLTKVLVDMEYEGIRIDPNILQKQSKELEQKINTVEKEIYQLAGAKFNISSPRQVGDLLFDHMKIPYKGVKTKTGQYVTDEGKLEELAAEVPIVAHILEYRMLAKLKSTYVDSLPLLINPKSHRIHSSFNQALAATGRLSSNNPNLQNIPIRTQEGRKVREAFVPRDDSHVLLSADYSQIELRLIAEISKDAAMLDAFIKGYDIHTATAARVYNVPLDQVTSDQRRNAKTVNFSITYGAGATNLSKQLGIKRAEAKELIDQYFIQYAGLKKYMDSTVEFARNHGYVETLLGRRRILRDIDSRNALARAGAERVAINTPIQGTAADLIKIAMINIHRKFEEKKIQSKLVLQVHDELIFDVLSTELQKVMTIVEHEMKNAIPGLKVPIEVGMGVGKNWLEAH